MKLSQYDQDLLDVEGLMSNDAFRRFMLRAFETFGILRTTFVANAQTQSAYAEGRRSAALEILDWCAVARPDALVAILSEIKPSQPQEQQNGRRREYPRDPDAE